MKSNKPLLAILTLAIVLAGCTENLQTYIFRGSVVYNGKSVGVRSGGPQLELWQYDYHPHTKIAVNMKQDGTFSASLVDGNYKLVPRTVDPWAQTDSINVTIPGNTTVDVPVTPYFTITGESFVYNKTDSTITSTCIVTKVSTLAVSSLSLYVGTTIIVDANNKVLTNTLNAAALADLTTPKTNKVILTSDMKKRQYVYVRLGVQISGISERLYTTPQKIMLQ